MAHSLIDKLNKLESILLSQNEKPLTLSEAADYLNISRSYLYKITCKKGITFFKPNNKKIYFKKSDLNKWLFRNQSLSEMIIEQKAIEYIQKRGN